MMRFTYRRVFSRRRFFHVLATLVGIAFLQMASSAQASPGDTELVSIVPSALPADTSSVGIGHRFISGDGRFVVFTANWGDGYGVYTRLFVRDRETGITEPIDVTPSGQRSNGDSYYGASISANGRYVAFHSDATDLVAGHTGSGLFLRDLQTHSTVRLANGVETDISADGWYVTFTGWDDLGRYQVFVLDRQTGTTEQVSLASAGTPNGWSPSISADGRYVAFVSADRVFLRDRQAGTTERVDVSTSGVRANSESNYPALSADGRFVAFESAASNLVPDDTNATRDIFVRDRVGGTTERVSVGSTGDQADESRAASISADGRYVAFQTLHAFKNSYHSIFVRDRELRTTELASVTKSGVPANYDSTGPNLIADGRVVAFTSNATNLATNDPDGGLYDVFVHELGGTSFNLKPTSMAFGNQALNTSTTLNFWLTNTGPVALPITSVGLGGNNPGMFSLGNGCGTSLAVWASCRIRVTFRPTSVGAKSATLRLVAGNNDVRTQALNGTGVISTFTVSPTSLGFGSVPINTTSAAKLVNISNTGTAVLPISSIALGGWNLHQFAQANNCPANLAVGATCAVSVVFKPTATGSKAAFVNITPGGGAAMRSVALAGAARR